MPTWIKASKGFPKQSGIYCMRVRGSKWVQFYSPKQADQKVWIEEEYEWLDENEPEEHNQDVLWDELEAIIDKELLEEYGPHYMVSSATISDLKQTYTLIRK